MGVINRLSELLSNQIAAGEVVGSPSSLIKELVENSVDAQSSYVIISVKDGGKSTIQVMDDGVGMSADDALLAFERHATSKIKSVDDLFNISTFGFRGEALASIAAVSEVEMCTKQECDELGTKVVINGGDVVEEAPEAMSCPHGTQITISNLFYNVPARKKSLKSNTTENRRIATQFIRVALAYHHIAFSLYVDSKPLYMLNSCNNIRQRIKYLMGDHISSNLLDVYVDTPMVEVKGYVGSCDIAKKRAESFFFVNGRYFESPYLYKAVQSGFEKLLPEGSMVPFFIFLKVDPENVDVNITPTKTTVRFDDETAIWQVVNAVVRESLGKNGIVPMIDFTQNANIPELNNSSPQDGVEEQYKSFESGKGEDFLLQNVENHTVIDGESYIEMDSVPTQSYASVAKMQSYTTVSGEQRQCNPFTEEFSFSMAVEGNKISFRDSILPESEPYNGGDEEVSSAFNTFSELAYDEVDSSIFSGENRNSVPLFEGVLELTDSFVLNDTHGVASINGSLFVFDIKRAQLALHYSRYIKRTSQKESAQSQKLLFPCEIAISAADKMLLGQCKEPLTQLGFIFADDFQSQNLVVESVPSDINPSDAEWFIEDILSALKFYDLNVYALDMTRQAAASLAKTATRRKNERITNEEFSYIVSQLLLCDEYTYTHDGKRVFVELTPQYLISKF